MLTLLPLVAGDRTIPYRNEAIEAGAVAMRANQPRDFSHKDAAAFRAAYRASRLRNMRGRDLDMYVTMDWYNAYGNVDELLDELAAMYDGVAYPDPDDHNLYRDQRTMHVDARVGNHLHKLKAGMPADVIAQCKARAQACPEDKRLARLQSRWPAISISTNATLVRDVQYELAERRQHYILTHAYLKVVNDIRADKEEQERLALERQAQLARLCAIATTTPVDVIIPHLKRLIDQAEKEESDAKRHRR